MEIFQPPASVLHAKVSLNGHSLLVGVGAVVISIFPMGWFDKALGHAVCAPEAAPLLTHTVTSTGEEIQWSGRRQGVSGVPEQVWRKNKNNWRKIKSQHPKSLIPSPRGCTFALHPLLQLGKRGWQRLLPARSAMFLSRITIKAPR